MVYRKNRVMTKTLEETMQESVSIISIEQQHFMFSASSVLLRSCSSDEKYN